MGSVFESVGRRGAWVLILGSTLACAEGGESGLEQVDGPARGQWVPAGKADEAASCAGFCWQDDVPTPAGCYCDAQCLEFDPPDCCPDFELECLEEGSTQDDPVPNDPGPAEFDICYPGLGGDDAPCFDLVAASPYSYPPPVDDRYVAPIRWLDVQSLDGETRLSPNFRLRELCVPYKGRYQVVQRHALENLQRVRDEVGALIVTSGFRSPPYNAQQPGAATHSRHMYGDAFDLVPANVSQNTLRRACEEQGADYVATYASGHVHCDWRSNPNDPAFFPSLAQADPLPVFSAETLTSELLYEDGVMWVEASGFDESEGELTRWWTALDADGEILATSDSFEFEPPAGTAIVEVDVGSLEILQLDL